jgi:hypothetical protein
MAALDRLRKDAEARVERAKEEVRNQINEQLENTTKRTILENERLAAELGYQSRQTEKLLKRQQLLLDESTELRRQLQVSNKTQDAMARRNHTYQKTIKTLVGSLLLAGTCCEVVHSSSRRPSRSSTCLA